MLELVGFAQGRFALPRSRTILLACAVALSPLPTWANDAPETAKATVALDFARLGFRATPLMSDGRCELTMTLDSRTFLAHVGELEKIGLINRDEAPKRIDAMPDTLAMAFLLQMAPGQTEKLYRTTPMADLCHFTQYLTAEAGRYRSPLARADLRFHPGQVRPHGLGRHQQRTLHPLDGDASLRSRLPKAIAGGRASPLEQSPIFRICSTQVTKRGKALRVEDALECRTLVRNRVAILNFVRAQLSLVEQVRKSGQCIAGTPRFSPTTISPRRPRPVGLTPWPSRPSIARPRSGTR